MKKNIFWKIATLILLVSNNALGQEVKFNSKIENDVLKGEIDSVIVCKYLARIKDSIIEKREPREEKYKLLFNEKNLITNKIYYGLRNNKLNFYKFDYSESNNVIKETSVNSNGENKFIIELAYGEKERLLEEKHWSMYGKNEKWIVKNNYDNNTALRYYVKSDDTYSNSGTKYYYNSSNLIEKVESDEFVWIYSYDGIGNLKKKYMDQYMQAINLDDESEKVYLSSEEMTYDAYSNMVTYVKKSNGRINKEKKFSYHYDSNGNWVKQIEFWKDEPVFIYERVIYYK